MTCLDASSFAAQFTITDTSFCAVAIYTTSESLGFSSPSWGSHGGPLTLVQSTTNGDVTLERWTAPSGTTGALTKTSVDVAANIPSDAYASGQANDLPFFSWTALSWTGPGAATTGDLLAIAGGAVAESYTANGPYAVVGISDGNGQGRVLYTGLSPLGSPTTDTNGLYAADACSAPTKQLGGGTGCSPSALVSAWGENSGPIVADKAGNVFAVLTSSTVNTQEARGFLAANVARGKGATPGVTLFTVPGFSGNLAAITPTSTKPGLLVFQSYDTTTADALDVIEQEYTAGTDIAATGSPSTLLTVPSGIMTGLGLMTDGSDRLWVAYTDTSSTTYVVLQRTP